MEMMVFYDVGMENGTFHLWWSVELDGDGGMGVMVKEDVCEKVI